MTLMVWSFRRYYFPWEILKYIEKRTKKRAILEADGDVAPYNGDPEFNINSDKAKSLEFMFTDIHDWIEG